MATRDLINLHLVSDATGETLNSLARAVLAQFEGLSVVHHRWTLIRSRLQLDRVLAGIELEPGPVLFTLLDRGLRTELELFCRKLNLPLLSVLDPAQQLFVDYVGRQGGAKPGRQYVLDQDYFQRIDAMHYVLAHDDGQGEAGVNAADVILVGVSRSSKTPTCFYLANRGVKAANIPLVPGAALPDILDAPPAPVVGLTIDVNALLEIRRHRLKMIGAGGGPIRASETAYVDPERVKEELIAARRLCAARGWPVIDVTRRSIEETAASVLQLMEAWHKRRAEAAGGRA